jgi:hypothetical protein
MGGQHAGMITPPIRPQLNGLAEVGSGGMAGNGLGTLDSTPRLFGVPLKYISYVVTFLVIGGSNNLTFATQSNNSWCPKCHSRAPHALFPHRNPARQDILRRTSCLSQRTHQGMHFARRGVHEYR